MALDFNIDEELAKVDTRSRDELRAAAEGISREQLVQDRWFNERKQWLEFFPPQDVGFLERVVTLGLGFKCLNCGKKRFEAVGQWVNSAFGRVTQVVGPLNHCIYRCRECGNIRIVPKVED